MAATSLLLNSNHPLEEHDQLLALLLCLEIIFLFLNYSIVLQSKNSPHLYSLYFHDAFDCLFLHFFTLANCSSQMYLLYFMSPQVCDLLCPIYGFYPSNFILSLLHVFRTSPFLHPSVHPNCHHLRHSFELNQIF